MNRKSSSTHITLWVNRLILLLLFVLLFALPGILDWYCTVRSLLWQEYLAILIAFYLCAAVTGFALWRMDRLLRNLLAGQVFTHSNVRCIQSIQWCCGSISLICLAPAFVYLPLSFMVVIMAFLCLSISVVAQVMRSAVAIREENDLTI